MSTDSSTPQQNGYAQESNLPLRHRNGLIWAAIFQISTIIGIITLTALLYNIVEGASGYVAYENKIDPASLSVDGLPLEQLSKEKLLVILQNNVSKGLFRQLEREKPMADRTTEEVYLLIQDKVVESTIVYSWSLMESLFEKDAIQAQIEKEFPSAKLVFTFWLDQDFVTSPQSSNASLAGIRTAILGTLWTIGITILFAFPIGVGAAIYLEEYARENLVNRIIQTNITNLAGVPSIIYGMLGLAVFVRGLSAITSGQILGIGDPTTANGRTILSAALTLGILVLPLLIINAQEAIRAVPNSLRQASFGLGATRWQTIWSHVFPNALPGILTGTILSISRAIGETAPLVVVGAATYITYDPNGPFSKFTTLPIQVYQWTSRAQNEFHGLAAAAIIVLLILLLSLNATAILLRNRFSRRIS